MIIRQQHARTRLGDAQDDRFRTDSPMRFGLHLVIDLYACNPVMITERDRIAKYAGQLVELLGMVAYGDPMIEHFGHADPVTSGYTLVQLIETSSITAHFGEAKRTAHLDIFSCRTFDAEAALTFTEAYFGARESTYTLLTR